MKALLLAALISTVAALPSLPWTRYQDVPNVGQVFPVACPQGPVGGVNLPGGWQSVFTSERDVWVHFNEAGEMDAAHFTKGTWDDGKIEVVRSQPRTTAIEACGWLHEVEVDHKT